MGEKSASPLGAIADTQRNSGEPELHGASWGIGQDEGRSSPSHPDEACGGEEAPFGIEGEERIGVGLASPEVSEFLRDNEENMGLGECLADER